MSKNQVILVISDLHIPYEHKDALAFLKALKAKYKPTQVICIGDEVDYHALSFHDSDPDLDSAGVELFKAKKKLKEFYKLFPEVTLVDSNHGSMIWRKAMASGIPKEAFKNYNEVLDAPKGWKWVDDITVKLSDGTSCYFHHSRGVALRTGQVYGMSHVCGHHHESFNINYWSTPERLSFAMTVGCLVDRKSLALAYAKNNLKRQILGVGLIVNGVPQLVPMLMGSNSRWVKKL
jgi:hypothetical protein